jgi:hypothetical protein
MRVALQLAMAPCGCGTLVVVRTVMETKHSGDTGHEDPPGIVIHGTFAPSPRPSISAFIWGGKVQPVPALPYGRRPAA